MTIKSGKFDAHKALTGKKYRVPAPPAKAPRPKDHKVMPKAKAVGFPGRKIALG